MESVFVNDDTRMHKQRIKSILLLSVATTATTTITSAVAQRERVFATTSVTIVD